MKKHALTLAILTAFAASPSALAASCDFGLDPIAIGDGATADCMGVAIGNAAEAEKNSVALGFGSEAEEGTVSLGRAPNGYVVQTGEPIGGITRRLTNMADGINPTDGVNVRQLDAMGVRLDARIDDVDERASRGIAALAAMQPVAPSAPGKTAAGVGVGHYAGSAALALSVAHAVRPENPGDFAPVLSFGVGYAGAGSPVVRAGAGWEF